MNTRPTTIKRVHIDCDGVMADYPSAVAMIARQFGMNHVEGDPSDPTDYNMIESGWFTSREEWKLCHAHWIENEVVRTPIMDTMKEEIAQVFSTLHGAGIDTAVVTSRTPVRPGEHILNKLRNDTAVWLKNAGVPVGKTELRLATKANEIADVHIDDNPIELERIAEKQPHARLILIDHAYNRNVTKFERVGSLAEVPGLLLG